MSYVSLLTLAEEFRLSGEIGLTIQCLSAASQIEDLSNLQKSNLNYLVGKLLLKYGTNKSDCKEYLLAAIQTARNEITDPKMIEIYFQSCLLLADYISLSPTGNSEGNKES